MLNHPYVLGELARIRRNVYLEEANNHQRVRQAKKEQVAQASLLKRLVAFLDGLRIGAVRPVGDQASLFSDETITAGRR